MGQPGHEVIGVSRGVPELAACTGSAAGHVGEDPAFLSPPATPDAETTAMAWPNLAAAPATSQRREVPAPKEGPGTAQRETSTGTGSPGELESFGSCHLPVPRFPRLPQGWAGVTSSPHRARRSTGAAGPGAGVQHPARHAGEAERAGPRGRRRGLRPHACSGCPRWVVAPWGVLGGHRAGTCGERVPQPSLPRSGVFPGTSLLREQGTLSCSVRLGSRICPQAAPSWGTGSPPRAIPS